MIRQDTEDALVVSHSISIEVEEAISLVLLKQSTITVVIFNVTT
jgi:hypothetical protein